jgi:Tol biopolymer transport system component
MSACHRALALILLVLPLAAGCGAAEPMASATWIALKATDILPPPTTSPVPLTATDVPPSPTVTPQPTGTPEPTPTSTLVPTALPTAPDDLEFDVPVGNPPRIDGRLSPEEWSGARTVSLADGELLFMHDGTYLYLAIRSDVLGLGSICVDRGDNVAILHSSASLGTAIYKRADENWRRTRDFSWTNSYRSHLQKEDWLASDVNMGAGEEMEYQIAMPEGVVRLAVTYLKQPDLNSATVWPAHLADDCPNIDLLRGYAPVRMQLSPETWMTVIASATPVAEPVPTSSAAGGGVIAFTSERDGNADIYTIAVPNGTDADGGEQGWPDLRRLTDDPAYDGWPTWSPDGAQIAFMSDRSGNPDIYVMDADGGNLRQLTDHPANDIWPEWSPDGKRIAFPSRRDGNFEIYVMDADGSNLQRLTNTPGHEDFPAWSPDGKQILFTRIEGNNGTYVMDVPDGTDADGGEQGSHDERRLLGSIALEPAWSPDGTRIAFGSDRGGFRAIYMMDADGSNLQKLSKTRAGENCPTWSPDGTRIAFASWRDGDGEIYVMDADADEQGSRNLQKLTNNWFEDEFPAWRPEPAASSGGNRFEPFVVTYGGPRNDQAFDVLVTEDGGSLIVGLANNTGLSHRITPGNAQLIRTKAQGTVIWEKQYGGRNDAYFSSIIQAGEDEYVLLGEIAASYARDETDVYLVKVDGEGNEIWSRTFGGRGMEFGKMVRQTADGGYILVGDQADEYPTDYVYESNIYLIKTDAKGNLVWSRTYGNKILYIGWGVAQTPDDGYILCGWEAKTLDDRDVILIKTDEVGELEWSRTWDLGERDGGFDLILTSDGYVVIACIQSMGSGGPSAVLIKVDLDGNEIWNKLIGEEGVGNTFWHIVEDVDGGYVMAGDTHLGKVPGTREDKHGAWMIKTDTEGEILWQHVFGEGEYEQAHFRSAALLPDGGYIFVGDVTPNGKTYSDMVWMRIDD